MKNKYKRLEVVTGIALALGVGTPSVQASPVMDDPVLHWSGVMTLLDPNGLPLINTSYPYYGDPTWGYGLRTQISGTLAFDLYSGTGSCTVAPFEFFNGWSPSEMTAGMVQAIGDGAGGSGTLLLSNMLFQFSSGAHGIPLSIVWDAAGLFGMLIDGTYLTESVSGVGAIPASQGIKKGSYPIGPAPLATTVWNTTSLCNPSISFCMGLNPSGGLPLLADSVGGSPFIDGPFQGYSMNLDITSMHVAEYTCIGNDCGPWVPVPAAIWLFGSGLLGLCGVSWRRRS